LYFVDDLTLLVVQQKVKPFMKSSSNGLDETILGALNDVIINPKYKEK